MAVKDANLIIASQLQDINASLRLLNETLREIRDVLKMIPSALHVGEIADRLSAEAERERKSRV